MFELISAIAIIYIITKVIRKARGTKKNFLRFRGQDSLNIETSGRFIDHIIDKEKVSVESMQGTVRYTGEDTSNLKYGSKILRSLESLRKKPRLGKPSINRRLRQEGGHTGGRRIKVVSDSSRGRYAWYRTAKERPTDIALVPTIKMAALKQRKRKKQDLQIVIKPEDIREKVREYSAPYSIILLLDMSLSMISARANIVETIYSFHHDVYRQRDRVGLIVFKGSKAYTLQHPTRNLDLVIKKLKNVGASDFTPLAAGLLQSWKALKQEKLRNRDAIQHLYIISDGNTNVPLDRPLSPLTRRRYTNEAQADAFDVARLLTKEKIQIHIINTVHSEEDVETFPSIDEERRIRLTPTQFLKELARISKGQYKGLKLKKNES
jgi:Mg-chelatase subunit ChlD